ncbi:MAG: molecular chaperone TorD family protein [Sulfuritalea sp.]|jgi:TorA maturation chaperone TorD|nr:molecular chaperone TorD family protein [Sulfuritalea sp.]
MTLDAEVASALAEDAATLALLHDSELARPVLAGLKEADFPANLGLLPMGPASLGSFEMMRTALASLPDSPDAALLDELAADFAAIYLTGAFGASPSESYWLSDDHLVCQDAMFDLRTLYAENGLAVPDWRKRPDDHLVFQLQFLARRLDAAATPEDWRALGRFLDYHLLRWLPDFAGRVADRCDTMFYAALALLTDAWLQQLRDLIADHLGESRTSREEIAASLGSRREAEAVAVPIAFMPGAAGPSW